MNSSGRLLSAVQAKEIYRRRARARLEGGRRPRAGEVETLQQRGCRAYRGRSEGRATASFLAAGRWVVRGGGVVSTSLLLCVGLQLASRLAVVLVLVGTAIAGGRSFSAVEELRATRRSAAPGSEKEKKAG